MSAIVYVASNEQKPWASEEIGFPTFPMPLKTSSGVAQVGDYHAEVDGRILPFVVERKSLADAYGSFVIEKNRARLYREIDRYNLDERFKDFFIVIESTEKQFMDHFPWPVLIWHKKRGDAQRFCAITQKKKATVLQHLEDRGAQIIFAGSRELAALTLGAMIETCIKEDLK